MTSLKLSPGAIDQLIFVAADRLFDEIRSSGLHGLDRQHVALAGDHDGPQPSPSLLSRRSSSSPSMPGIRASSRRRPSRRDEASRTASEPWIVRYDTPGMASVDSDYTQVMLSSEPPRPEPSSTGLHHRRRGGVCYRRGLTASPTVLMLHSHGKSLNRCSERENTRPLPSCEGQGGGAAGSKAINNRRGRWPGDPDNAMDSSTSGTRMSSSGNTRNTYGW
jgi:hypothetical protein